MRVQFVVPPIKKQVGGIATALRGRETSLARQGQIIGHGPDFLTSGVVHHIHGLWNIRNSLICRQLKSRNLPYVISPHGMLEPWALKSKGLKKNLYLTAVERQTLCDAAAVMVTSELEKTNLLSVVPNCNVEVHMLGVADSPAADYYAARHELGWLPDERIILFLSRIDRKKGLHLLLDALEFSASSLSQISLVVVGAGTGFYAREVQKRAMKLKPRMRRLDWIGPVWGDTRWKYMQGADLLCLPTYSENFGLVVLEALSVGTPVLTTNATPWRDLAQDGVFICEPQGNAVAATLSRALEAPWTSERRSSLSQWILKKFDWDAIASSYLSSYSRAAGI